jgi:hypothetical protein
VGEPKRSPSDRLPGRTYQLYVNGIPGGAGATSGFGYPASDETVVTGGAFDTFAGTSCTAGDRESDFENATILWNKATHQATVYLYS